MKPSLALFVALTAVSSANAALPPYWDRVQQFKTVVESPEVNTKLEDAKITKVSFVTESGRILYDVWAESRCGVRVELEPIAPPDGQVGPTQYRVKAVGPKVCRR